MTYTTRIAALALLLAAFLVPFTASVALAHGHTTVGDYELVVGFINEPAYQSEPNGLDLRITNTTTSQPVTGLEDTLKAELTFGESTVELPIEARWGEEGAYTANIIPTQAGAYTWRIFGTIENTPVDVSMTSGPEAFSEIRSKSAVSFPAAEPTAAELAGQVAQARMFGIAGSVLGLAGLVVAAITLPGRRAPQAQATAQRRQQV